MDKGRPRAVLAALDGVPPGVVNDEGVKGVVSGWYRLFGGMRKVTSPHAARFAPKNGFYENFYRTGMGLSS